MMFPQETITKVLNYKLEKNIVSETKSTNYDYWLQEVKDHQVKRRTILQARCNYCKYNSEDNCDHLILENKKQIKEFYSRLFVDEKHKVN